MNGHRTSTPNNSSNPQYYFYVEIDPENKITEVHEERYKSDNTTINDYGGNKTGFYPFYVYNVDDGNSSGGVVASSAGYVRVVADEIQFNIISFTDGDGKEITDINDFIRTYSGDSFVTITTSLNYLGAELHYAFLLGCELISSGRQKLPGANLNTIVDLNKLNIEDIANVFSLNDIALHNGYNQITFTVSPSEIIEAEKELASKADSLTFGLLTLTDEEMNSVEEFFEGVDPSFTLEAIPDNIVLEGVVICDKILKNQY